MLSPDQINILELDELRESNKRMDDAIQNALGLLDTAIAKRKFNNDDFYNEVLQSLKEAI